MGAFQCAGIRLSLSPCVCVPLCVLLYICMYIYRCTHLCVRVVSVFALLCVLHLSSRLEFSPVGAQFHALQMMKPV